jgi:Ulp1 family protease
MPINVSGVHWVLLAAHVPTVTVSIVDSLNSASSKTYFEKWK